MRKYIIHSLTILSYLTSIYFLFMDFRIWFGIAGMVALFIFYHLSILDTPSFAMRYAGKVFVGVIILGSLLATVLWYNWTTSVALALMHIGLRALGSAIYSAMGTHIRFLLWKFIVSGLGIWTLCVTFVPLILGIGMLHTIPIDCGSIRFEQLTHYIESHYTTTPPKEQVDLVGALDKSLETIGEGKSQWMSYLVSELNLLKNQTIHQILQDRSMVQGQICDSIITEANKRLQQPWVQVSVIFLLFIVLYPVMGVVMLLASAIWHSLLVILLRSKVYKKSLETVQAERII